eukprot:90712_1
MNSLLDLLVEKIRPSLATIVMFIRQRREALKGNSKTENNSKINSENVENDGNVPEDTGEEEVEKSVSIQEVTAQHSDVPLSTHMAAVLSAYTLNRVEIVNELSESLREGLEVSDIEDIPDVLKVT